MFALLADTNLQVDKQTQLEIAFLYALAALAGYRQRTSAIFARLRENLRQTYPYMSTNAIHFFLSCQPADRYITDKI